MRVFLGIPIPPGLAGDLYACTSGLRDALSGVSWVKPQNYHITMLFLGELEPEEIERIKKVMKSLRIDGGAQANLGHIGQFPPRGAARVIYAGLDAGADACRSAYSAVCGAIPEYAEKRRYIPHITLGRVKRGRRLLLGREQKAMLPEKTFSLEEIVLYRSVLRQSGAEYHRLYSKVL